MLLYNVKQLSVRELQKLYIEESKRYLEGVKSGASYNYLQEIKKNLNSLSTELESRNR